MGDPASFSVVIPVADRDSPLVPRTLPSWLALGADEVILATDKPASPELRESISRTAQRFAGGDSVQVVEVPRNNAYRFQQAFARRRGFTVAKNNAILTGDIDLIVRKSVTRAIALVGKEGVGIVSISKVRGITRPAGAYRAVSWLLMQRLHLPRFVGLYALWRPFWLETEDEGIRYVKNVRVDGYRKAGLGILGEDTYLYLSMRRKHKCLHMNRVGGIDVARFLEDLPRLQYEWGRVAAETSASWLLVLASVLLAYPNLLRGYVHQKRERKEFIDIFGKDFDWREIQIG